MYLVLVLVSGVIIRGGNYTRTSKSHFFVTEVYLEVSPTIDIRLRVSYSQLTWPIPDLIGGSESCVNELDDCSCAAC